MYGDVHKSLVVLIFSWAQKLSIILPERKTNVYIARVCNAFRSTYLSYSTTEHKFLALSKSTHHSVSLWSVHHDIYQWLMHSHLRLAHVSFRRLTCVCVFVSWNSVILRLVVVYECIQQRKGNKTDRKKKKKLKRGLCMHNKSEKQQQRKLSTHRCSHKV